MELFPSPAPASLSQDSKKVTFLDSLWISVNRTTGILQPEAVDKAINFWMYYFQAYKQFEKQMSSSLPNKTQMKRALDTVELPNALPIRETNLNIYVKISDTGLCIPFIKLGNFLLCNSHLFCS